MSKNQQAICLSYVNFKYIHLQVSIIFWLGYLLIVKGDKTFDARGYLYLFLFDSYERIDTHLMW